MLVGWQVGNLAYRGLGTSEMKVKEQGLGNIGVEEQDSD